MKKSKMLQALKNLHGRLMREDFSTPGEDRALAKIIRKMEKRQEGKYTVVFAYPEELTDGNLLTCVEFITANSVDAAIQRACSLRGRTTIAVFKGHRQCLYSEA